MPAIVQLEDHVSNFDHLVDAAFWAECGTFTAYPRTAPDEVVPRAKEAELLLINKIGRASCRERVYSGV